MTHNPPFLIIDGVIVRQQIVDAPEADRIAQANGFVYAEQFVKAYAGKRAWLDSKLKVTTSTEIKSL